MSMEHIRKGREAVSTTTIPLDGGPNQRLELELTPGAKGREVVIREFHWGNGVGWFVHKSIRLDAGQVEGLLKALCCLRQPASLKPLCPFAEGPRVEGVLVEGPSADAVSAPTLDGQAANSTAPQGGRILKVDFGA